MMSFSWIMAYIILLSVLMIIVTGGKVCCVALTIVELIIVWRKVCVVKIIKNGIDLFN